MKSLSEYDFSIMMTMKFPMVDLRMPKLDFNQTCVRHTHRYLKRLSIKCYGNKASSDHSKRVQHFTFFEDKTKYGDPTVFHAHSLVIVSESNLQRFSRYVEHEWPKIMKSVGHIRKPKLPHLVTVDDKAGIVDYVTKHANNDYEFLCQLPPLG
jgi:hypothetical protein